MSRSALLEYASDLQEQVKDLTERAEPSSRPDATHDEAVLVTIKGVEHHFWRDEAEQALRALQVALGRDKAPLDLPCKQPKDGGSACECCQMRWGRAYVQATSGPETAKPCAATKLVDGLEYVCRAGVAHAGCASGLHAWQLVDPKDWRVLYRACVAQLSALAEIVGNTNGDPEVTIGIVRNLAAMGRERAKTDERGAASGSGSAPSEVRQGVSGAEGEGGDRVAGPRQREGVGAVGPEPSGVDAGLPPAPCVMCCSAAPVFCEKCAADITANKGPFPATYEAHGVNVVGPNASQAEGPYLVGEVVQARGLVSYVADNGRVVVCWDAPGAHPLAAVPIEALKHERWTAADIEKIKAAADDAGQSLEVK